MAPSISLREKLQIIALRRAGHTVSQICQKMRVSRQTIYFWLRRWEEEGNLESHRRETYQRATTAAQDEEMVAMHQDAPLTSTRATAENYNISPWTVRRRLRQGGLMCRRRAKKIVMSPADKENTESSIEVEDEAVVASIQQVKPGMTPILPKITNEEQTKKYLAKCVHKVFNFESSSLTDVDKFKRRLIRSIARYRFVDKIPETEMWEKLRKDTDCDCFLLVKRMRALTLKKLKRLLVAEDMWENITKVARLTMTDWLLFDLVLVHENVDLIGKDSKSENPEDPKVLYELLELVVKYNIEYIKRKKDRIILWLQLTLEYNSRGRQCSPMLLQRRWYQMKQMTRLKFYSFWYSYRGVNARLEQAWNQRPSELQATIAKSFPKIVVKEFPEWEELIASEVVILREDFENLSIIEPPKTENVADVQIIETPVETIQIDEDSDVEDVGTSSVMSETEAVALKEKTDDGTLGVCIYKVKTEPVEKNASSTPHAADENLIDQENETRVSLVNEGINEILPISDEIDSNGDNELLPKIMNVTGGVELIESDNEPDTVNNTQPQHYASDPNNAAKENEGFIEIDASTIRGSSEEVSKNCTTSDSNNILDNSGDKQDFEVHLDDLIILDDGITMEDEGAEEIECKDAIQIKTEPEQTKENVNKENDTPNFDFKLLLTPVVYTKKLNDMDVFKHTDFLNVRDKTIIECSYNESKLVNIKKKSKITKDLYTIKKELEASDSAFTQLELEKCSVVKTELKESTEPYNLISDHQKIKCSSWLLQKPKNRSYNPIQLCKNPDFNTRLKRLNAGFLMSERNRLLLKECKRLTIDLHKSFENKLIDGRLYLKNSKFAHHCNNAKQYVQEVTTNPLLEPQTVPILEKDKISKSYGNTLNIIHNELCSAAASEEPPRVFVDNKTKTINLNQVISQDPTSLIFEPSATNSDCIDSDAKDTNGEIKVQENSKRYAVTQDIKPSVNNCGVITSKKDDKPNIVVNPNNEVEENNKLLESGEILNKDAHDINSHVEGVDNNDIEIQELNPIKTKKKLSKLQIERSLQRLFIKAPINYKGSVSMPSRIPLKWDANAKSSQSINMHISNAYGDALLATSSLEKMINVLTPQPPEEKSKKYKRKVSNNQEGQKIHWRKKQFNQIKAQNVKHKSTESTVKNIEDVTEIGLEEIDKDSNKNNNSSIESDKPTEENEVMSEKKKNRYCCWALEKLITKKKPEIPHTCPHPVCICCCRDRLLQQSLEDKVIKGRVLPYTAQNKPPTKNINKPANANKNKASKDIIQITLSDDDENDDNAKNRTIDNNEKVDPNNLKKITIHYLRKDSNNVESIPVQQKNDINLPLPASEIQTTFKWKTTPETSSDSSFQACKTRVYSQKSPISSSTSTRVELPPLKVTSSGNGRILKPMMDSSFIQPNNTNVPVSKSTKDSLKYNVLPNCNDSSKPIFIGKNKILLCSVNKSESPIAELSKKDENYISSLLPPGVEIVLLPSGELALSIKPGMDFNTDEIAQMSEILMSVQKQITSSGNNIDTPKTTGVDFQKQENNEIIAPCETNSHDTNKSSEILVTTNIPNYNSQQLENIVGHDIESHVTSEANKHTDEKESVIEDTQGLQTLNETDSLNSKKSILSDLMEMSGISEKDTAVSEAKTLNTPENCPVTPMITLPLEISPTQTHIKTNYPNISLLNPQNTRKELSIVSSFDELKKCHEKSCQFYKMDIETGQILPINLKIKKKLLTNDIKRNEEKMKSTAGPSGNVIDLTDDEDKEKSKSKAVETGNIKPIKLIRTVHSTNLNPRKLEPRQYKLQGSQDSSRLINILTSKRSLLKVQARKISQSRIIESKEPEEYNNAISDAPDSDSDDEPLAKKALRKRDGDENVANTESTESPDVSAQLENKDGIDCYTPEFIEADIFEDSDENEDCILGV